MRRFLLLPLLAGPALAPALPAQAVFWPPNGHWYEAVSAPAGIDWMTAVAITSAPGQHLAVITDASENAFVFSLINAPLYWQADPSGENVGPWIGAGLIPGGPNGLNWYWATAEPFLYTAWASGQPNGSGDLGAHFADPAAPTRAATWGDRAAAAVTAPGYVVEYEFMLDGLVPGAAGGPNGLFTSWGTPGLQVTFLASLQAGATAVPGCGGLVVNLASPVAIATAVTNAGGQASRTILIPGSLAGRGAFFQAVERSACRVTNLVYEVL